jgi:hypothetical protein
MRFSDLQDVDLVLELLEELLEALVDVDEVEHRLLVLELERQVRGDRVGQPAGVVDAGDRGQDLRRDLLVQLDVLVELLRHGAAQGLDLALCSTSGGTGVTSETKYSPLSVTPVRDRALDALDEHLHRAVGELQHLQDRRDAADLEHVVGLGLVLAGGLLRDQHDLAAGFHRDLERLDRLRAADEHGNDHVREDDDVAQGQQRQRDLLGGQNGVTGHSVPLFLVPM